MGRVAEVKGFEMTDDGPVVKVDMGGGDIATADHYADAGDDSVPLPGDVAAIEESTGAGSYHTAGYTDVAAPQKSAPGEKRVYARDPNTNETVCEVWCKNNGDIVLEVLSPSAQIHIKSAGPVFIESPDVRLGSAPGRPVACVGDLVAVSVPQLISAAPGSPCVPVPPTAITPTGGYTAAGQIISGRSSVKAGP